MLSRKMQQILMLLDEKKDICYADVKEVVRTKWFFNYMMNKLIIAGLIKKYNVRYSITFDGTVLTKKLRLLLDE